MPVTLRLPPTPPGHVLLGNSLQYMRDPLGHVEQWSREYGDVVRLRLPGLPSYLLTHPAHIEEVLRGSYRSFTKDRVTRRLSIFLGEGLLTSEGDFWRRQRRLAQPGFQGQQIEDYSKAMVDCTEQMLDRWQPGQRRDLHAEMMRLTLAIVAKTLFDADVSGVAAEIGEIMDEVMRYFLNPAVNWSRLPGWLPVPANIRFRRSVRRLDRIIYRLIAERRASGRDPGDLLSRLLAAHDEDGSVMTERQLRDELVTLLLAGHETTALVLSYGFYLLGRHPSAQQRLADEVREVLGGRPPAFADLPRLRYADWVVKETMRLFPPAWAVAREAMADCQIGGYDVPRGTQLWMPQWVVHRDVRWYDEPQRFMPERWENDLARRLPRCAYFPFGDGPRICIGGQFATVEAVLVLATIVGRYQLEVVPGEDLKPLPSITLRPNRGIEVIVHQPQPAAHGVSGS